MRLLLLFAGFTCCQPLLAQPAGPPAPDPAVIEAREAFEAGRYPEAAAKLQQVARQEDLSEQARAKALLLAGLAALRTEERARVDAAITLFGEAAELHEPLRIMALHHQANAKLQLGQPGEALAIYDAILAQQPADLDRQRALMGRGIALNQLVLEDAEAHDKAAASFEEVARDETASRTLRLEAAARATGAWRRAANLEAALAAARLARDLTSSPEAEGARWAQAAAFEAAHIEARNEQWQQAVDWMEEAAKLPGPLGERAALQAEQWRLTEFLWDET